MSCLSRGAMGPASSFPLGTQASRALPGGFVLIEKGRTGRLGGGEAGRLGGWEAGLALGAVTLCNVRFCRQAILCLRDFRLPP